MAGFHAARPATKAAVAADAVLRKVQGNWDGADGRRGDEGVVRMPLDLSLRGQQAEAVSLQGCQVQAAMNDTIMTLEELCDHVRVRMPVRARLVGKNRVDAIVSEVVCEWPGDSSRLASGGQAGVDALEDLKIRVAAKYVQRHGGADRYGCSVLLLFVLSTVIQLIFRWWSSRNSNRRNMAAWQAEMKGQA